MQKIHASINYQNSLDQVFAAISDHKSFLTGGGLTCELTQTGKEHPNGLGAVRKVSSKQYILFEEIIFFEKNKRFDYKITKTEPSLPLIHEKGWLTFTQLGDSVQVDWQSHFKITTPLIGKLVGWVIKKQIEKDFYKRLKFTQNMLNSSEDHL